MRYRITHRNEYRYDAPVANSYGEARLVPRQLDHQQSVAAPGIDVSPRPLDRSERTDYFGNATTYFNVEEPHTELTVTAVHEVEVVRTELQLDLTGGGSWEQAVARLDSSTLEADLDARQFRLASPLVATGTALAAYAAPSFAPTRHLLDAAIDLNHRIHADFTYSPGTTSISTSVGEILESRRGVCQDFAHLAVGCLRAMGLPARYVSGYLETDPPPGVERLVGADASHAWFAVYVPDHGWVDLDPTNDVLPRGRHITAAWGRDYADVTPLKGVVYTASHEHELTVSVDVERLPA